MQLLQVELVVSSLNEKDLPEDLESRNIPLLLSIGSFDEFIVIEEEKKSVHGTIIEVQCLVKNYGREHLASIATYFLLDLGAEYFLVKSIHISAVELSDEHQGVLIASREQVLHIEIDVAQFLGVIKFYLYSCLQLLDHVVD